MKKWVCTVCGYIHEGEEAPEICPLCGVGAEDFREEEQARVFGFRLRSAIASKSLKPNTLAFVFAVSYNVWLYTISIIL